MASLNSVKYQALFALTGGKKGTLSELEYAWLSGETGLSGITLSEQWVAYLTNLIGKPDLGINGQQMFYWGSLGYTGTWCERAYQFWEGGGSVGGEGTAILTAAGSNFAIGSNQPGSNPQPPTFEGLEIYYFGSFGQSYWNLRLGPAPGTSQIPGITQLSVSLGAAGPTTINWSAVNERYQGSTGQDLWAVLGADVGNSVPYTISALGGINMPDLTLGVGNNGGARHGYDRGSYGTSAPDLLTDGNEIRQLYVNNTNGRLVFKVEGTYPQGEFTSIQIVGEGGPFLTANADVFDDSGGETLWRWNSTGMALTDGDTLGVEFT